ncbi:MAG: glycosyltransferase family 39 protein [Bryobacteraceae bacterium]
MTGKSQLGTAAGRTIVWIGIALALWSAAAVWFVYGQGWTLYWGDAEAHLDIARRVADSQTPGYEQIGTVWLPLLHFLLLPLVCNDWLWRTGLAGSIPPAACFVAAGLFLFAAARRIFGSQSAAVACVALFALNPNMMYLQSIPMMESVFTAALAALLYFTVRFRQTQGWGAVCGAGMAACAGTLARYDGWFLLPFVAAYFFFAASRRRVAVTLLFCALAGAGPLYWLIHNRWYYGDALAFYRGPYSARAIQGGRYYPGQHNWALAWLQYRTAARLIAGSGLTILAMAGAVAALFRRAFWPLLLLALPGVFYIASLHSGDSPIFVPTLWPNTYYNTRFGLAALPLLALAAGALATLAPLRARAVVAALVVAGGAVPWLLHPRPSDWITFEESLVNSQGRRAWTRAAAAYLKANYERGSGILTSFGDMAGIYRRAGIPFRETFTGDNGLPWLAAVTRPELFLWQEWAVVMAGDPVDSAIERAARYGMRYDLETTIAEKGQPVIKIYRRTGGPHGPS